MTDERLIIALFRVELDAIVNLDTPLDTLHMDSLDFVDLMLKVENAFNVKIPQESIVRMNTVGDILSIVAEARSVSLPS
jgi:acyl carrier protein